MNGRTCRARRAVLPMVLAILFGCAQQTPSVPPPAAPEEKPLPRVIFPDGFVVEVEVAADDDLREQGLMFRDQLRPGTGMLFFFPRDGVYSFWMRNTRIPLDMIWIDAGQKVVHVKHDVPPCEVEDCPSYGPGVESRYVLEVAAGVARQHGLEAGQQLRFEGTGDVVVR